jgi:hypothetical protein
MTEFWHSTGPGRCSRGSRSWCARSLLGGSRLCSTRSSSSRGAAQGPGPRAARISQPRPAWTPESALTVNRGPDKGRLTGRRRGVAGSREGGARGWDS